MLTRILLFATFCIVLLSGCIVHFNGNGRLQLVAETNLVDKEEQERVSKLITQRLVGLDIEEDDIEIHHIQGGMSVTINHYSDYDDIELKRIRYAVEAGEHFALWETYLFSEVDDMLVKADSILSDSLNRENKDVADTGDTDGGGGSFQNRCGSNNSVLLRDVGIVSDSKGQPEESALLGLVNETDTAKVMQLLKLPAVKACFPKALKFAWGRPHYIAITGTDEYFLIALKKSAAGTARIPDPVIADAQEYQKSFTDPPKILVRFGGTAVDQWAAMTRENKGRDIAFAVDDYVVSTLRITYEIPDGDYLISHFHFRVILDDLLSTIKGGPSRCNIRVVSVQTLTR